MISRPTQRQYHESSRCVHTGGEATPTYRWPCLTRSPWCAGRWYAAARTPALPSVSGRADRRRPRSPPPLTSATGPSSNAAFCLWCRDPVWRGPGSVGGPSGPTQSVAGSSRVWMRAVAAVEWWGRQASQATPARSGNVLAITSTLPGPRRSGDRRRAHRTVTRSSPGGRHDGTTDGNCLGAMFSHESARFPALADGGRRARDFPHSGRPGHLLEARRRGARPLRVDHAARLLFRGG